MNEDRNQDRKPKQQAREKRPAGWQQDLNPTHMAGPNLGPASDSAREAEWNAFHLRKAGLDNTIVNDEDEPKPGQE